jgi:hypothetical protein
MKTNTCDTQFEKIKSRANPKHGANWKRLSHSYRYQNTLGFKCNHCCAYIHADETLSGVQNRNHCPYCLWSRHVDLYQSGDRLAACKAPMQPIGLSLKKTGKKYGCQNGELMVIHACSDCGSVSINRIAADDDAEQLYQIYLKSLNLDLQTRNNLDAVEIMLLDELHSNLVSSRLFGLDISMS